MKELPSQFVFPLNPAGGGKLLVVGAHPDDVEMHCGGTIALCCRSGGEATACVLTDGRHGHAEIPPEKLGPLRIQEATRAAGRLGAKFVCLGLPDATFQETEPRVERLAHMAKDPRTPAVVDRLGQLIAERNVDLLITHFPGDYHADHRLTTWMVQQALDRVAGGDFRRPRPRLFFMETSAGMEFLPTHWVDISEVIDVKRAALSEHQSQLQWILYHDGVDLLESMETTSRYRGIQAGVRYAEAFRESTAG